MGGYLGGKLSLAPHDVTLVGRPVLQEAVSRHGLILREIPVHGRQTDTVLQLRVTADASTLLHPDLVVLTVRAYDVKPALPDLERLLGQHGIVLAMQNGVGSEEYLADTLGRHRVLAGTLTVSAGMEEPGVITRYSAKGGIAISSVDGSPVPSWVVALCNDTNLPTIVVDDYRSLRWSKLLLNNLGGASTAILNVDMTTLVADRRLFRLEQLALREATRVMDRRNIKTVALPGYPVPLAALAMRLPRSLAQRVLAPRLARARGGRAPSMRGDVARGRSEVGYLNGAVVQAATELGLNAPVNEALAELTTQLTQHPEFRGAYAGNPDALVAYMRERGIEV